jgi:hypothetical protein
VPPVADDDSECGCVIIVMFPRPKSRATRSRRRSNDGMRSRCLCVDANIPAAPPTRAPEPNNISLEMRIAAGLRTCGHAARAGAGSYYEPLPNPTIRIAWDQCQWLRFVPIHRCGAVPDSHRVPS